MDKEEIRETIRRVLRRELDDCERALNGGDIDTARSELDGAIRKLKRLINAF